MRVCGFEDLILAIRFFFKKGVAAAQGGEGQVKRSRGGHLYTCYICSMRCCAMVLPYKSIRTAIRKTRRRPDACLTCARAAIRKTRRGGAQAPKLSENHIRALTDGRNRNAQGQE